MISGKSKIIKRVNLKYLCSLIRKPGDKKAEIKPCRGFRWVNKKWQVTYIAPLNHLPLLPSGPGGVQQELVV
jgi:hypothetical protein